MHVALSTFQIECQALPLCNSLLSKYYLMPVHYIRCKYLIMSICDIWMQYTCLRPIYSLNAIPSCFMFIISVILIIKWYFLKSESAHILTSVLDIVEVNASFKKLSFLTDKLFSRYKGMQRTVLHKIQLNGQSFSKGTFLSRFGKK